MWSLAAAPPPQNKVQDPKHVPRYFSRVMIKGVAPPQCYDNPVPPSYSASPHVSSLQFLCTFTVPNTGSGGRVGGDFDGLLLRNF
jgi:hypothetical protein